MSSAALQLLIGDIVAILLFATLGRGAHSMELGLAGILNTAFPFLIMWLLVAWLLGGYRPAAYENPGKAAVRAIVLVLVAGPLALLLRSFILSRPIVITFAIISVSTNLILLTLWRTAFAFFRGRKGAP